jgi:hypothetical protein
VIVFWLIDYLSQNVGVEARVPLWVLLPLAREDLAVKHEGDDTQLTKLFPARVENESCGMAIFVPPRDETMKHEARSDF